MPDILNNRYYLDFVDDADGIIYHNKLSTCYNYSLIPINGNHAKFVFDYITDFDWFTWFHRLRGHSFTIKNTSTKLKIHENLPQKPGRYTWLSVANDYGKTISQAELDEFMLNNVVQYELSTRLENGDIVSCNEEFFHPQFVDNFRIFCNNDQNMFYTFKNFWCGAMFTYNKTANKLIISARNIKNRWLKNASTSGVTTKIMQPISLNLPYVTRSTNEQMKIDTATNTVELTFSSPFISPNLVGSGSVYLYQLYASESNDFKINSLSGRLLEYWSADGSKPEGPPIDIDYGFPGKPSGPSGGDGEMTDTNEETDLRPPNISDVKYLTRVYKLNASQITSLRDYLWSDNFITNLPKLFSDPFSAIIGLQALPLDVEGSSANVYIGSLDSGVNGIAISYAYQTVDLGTVNVTEFWQSFLDYQPYTRLKLYLPYIGIVDLPTDQFMNNSIGIKYRIDVISGACVAVISNNTNIICQFTGNCATKMPISASDHASILSNSLVGLTAVAGNVAAGNVAGAVASSANVMLGLKEKIQISGSMATSHGILVNATPYLMIERPTSDIPANYAALKGFTSNISLKLSACSGFTKVSEIKLDGISATDEEKTELLALLQSGVYL